MVSESRAWEGLPGEALPTCVPDRAGMPLATTLWPAAWGTLMKRIFAVLSKEGWLVLESLRRAEADVLERWAPVFLVSHLSALCVQWSSFLMTGLSSVYLKDINLTY